MPDLPHALSATIEAIEGDRAILRTSDGQSLRWPLNLLKPDATIGEAVHLLILSDTDATQERQRLAKTVLSEMLKGN